MFTYIDPTVRERLTEQGTLFQIDRDGVLIEPGSAGSLGHTISILGLIAKSSSTVWAARSGS